MGFIIEDFCAILRDEFHRHLTTGRKRDSVRHFQIPATEIDFQKIRPFLVPKQREKRQRKKFIVDDFKNLQSVLGNFNYRIFNRAGDCVYALKSTICFGFGQRRRIKTYDIDGEEIPQKRRTELRVSFVVDSCNKTRFSQLIQSQTL